MHLPVKRTWFFLSCTSARYENLTSLKIGTGLSSPFDQIQLFFLHVFISVVVTFIIYLLNTLYFMMKYIWNTAEIRLHMDKSNIYFSNGNINCGKTLNTYVVESWLIVYFKKEKHGELGGSWHQLYSMHLPVKRTWFFFCLTIFFTCIYLCCGNIYNIFIKYIVLYDEIHLKYCRDTVAYG
jgi:hypothetical protein